MVFEFKIKDIDGKGIYFTTCKSIQTELCELALFKERNHSFCVTRYRLCVKKKSCRAQTVALVFPEHL